MQVERVADRRQRIAQLVRQRREELVLQAVGIAQLLRQLAEARLAGTQRVVGHARDR